MPRKPKSPPPCWSCAGSGVCDCIVCGYDARGPNDTVIRKAGKCRACIGRDFQERNAAALAPFDPRDRANWEHHPAADGNKGYRVYKPARGLK